MAKRYSPKLKFQIVLEALRGEQSIGQIAKAYGVHPNSIHKWEAEFLENGPEVFVPPSLRPSLGEFEVATRREFRDVGNPSFAIRQ
jgi:transposase